MAEWGNFWRRSGEKGDLEERGWTGAAGLHQRKLLVQIVGVGRIRRVITLKLPFVLKARNTVAIAVQSNIHLGMTSRNLRSPTMLVLSSQPGGFQEPLVPRLRATTGRSLHRKGCPSLHYLICFQIMLGDLVGET